MTKYEDTDARTRSENYATTIGALPKEKRSLEKPHLRKKPAGS